MHEKKHIFISHSSKDKAFVRFFYDRLNHDIQDALWVDLIEIYAGTAWEPAIENALNTAAALIVIFSPNSLNSEWVDYEIQRAKELGILIIPILSQGEVVGEYNEDQYIDARELEPETVVQRIMAALRKHKVLVKEKEAIYLKRLIKSCEQNLTSYIDLELKANATVEPIETGFEIIQQSATHQTSVHVSVTRIEQTFEHFPRFVLIGTPGSGKSTTLYKLVKTAAEFRLFDSSQHPLPVLIPLAGCVPRQRLMDKKAG